MFRITGKGFVYDSDDHWMSKGKIESR